MATISEHIEQLKIDKQTLVDNLVEKGVEATSEETFTTLVPKVKDIQSGADLSEYFAEELTKGSSSSASWRIAFLKFPPLPNSPDLTSFSYMFSGCSAKEIDISNLDWSNVTTAQYMFQSSGLTNLVYPNHIIEVPKLTDFTYVFQNCSKLESFDFSKFNFHKPINVRNCFQNCSNLISVNGGNIDVSTFAGFYQVFQTCSKLTYLDISNWDFSSATTFSSMFNGCYQLTDLRFGKNLATSINLSDSTLLTEESLISVLLGLADLNSLGKNTQTCNLGSTNLAKLTSEAGQQALAQAQAYGWTVS